MATYDLRDIIDSIESALSAAATIVRSQSYNELTEGIHDYPLLQVYAEENTGTDWTTETDRITLSGKHSLKEYLIYADLYARQRSHLAGDMAQLYESINALEDILDTQTCPVFGNENIASMHWSWRRVAFKYGSVGYVGARFSITVRVGAYG